MISSPLLSIAALLCLLLIAPAIKSAGYVWNVAETARIRSRQNAKGADPHVFLHVCRCSSNRPAESHWH